MATTFKTFLNNDIANARTLLHEAIPITGTIVSGTYSPGTDNLDNNIKNYSHGMFQSVFDFPYLSSSANHIFDITAGYSNNSALSGASYTQNSKKINIYTQHAQLLVGYDSTGSIMEFDQDGNIAAGGTKFQECFFLDFSRLLTKDEIKRGSVQFALYSSGSPDLLGSERADKFTVGDYGAGSSYKVNSPAGEYGLLFTSSETPNIASAVGHVYYQAGIAVLTASYFSGNFGDPENPPEASSNTFAADSNIPVSNALTGTSITDCADGVRLLVDNLQFNNTTELNSTIYFCRASTQDFNYSANPTYLTASKIRVKNQLPKAEPVAYITTVGLYSADNELLAVAKVSEPLKKSPSNEITLRVRLDY